MRILRQNFEQLGSVIGGTLINVFKPIVSALNVVIGKFIQFAKVVSDSLGKIFGWQYQDTGVGGVATELEDASDASAGVGSGLGKAADNSKKLKQQLQGFDELNVLTSDSGSGGSGGSGGGGGGGTSGGDASSGQWVKTESIFKDYESSLDSLYKLGDYIGNAITKSLNNIDWESVYEGARNFGSGLASFLNGLISPDLFGALGKTVAGSINTAFHALDSFGETFEWKEFGKSIATGINRILSDLDIETIMSGLLNTLKGTVDVVVGVIENLNWRQLGEKIIEVVKNIELGDVLSSLAEGIGAGLAGFVELIGGLISEGFSDIAKSINDYIEETGGYVIEGLLRGMLDALGNIASWIVDNIFKPFIEGFKSVFEINSPSEVMKEQGKYIIDGLYEGLKNNVQNIIDWFKDLPGKIKESLKTAWSNVKEWWKENAKLPKINVPSIEDIKNAIKEKWNDAKAWWKNKSPLSKVTMNIVNIKDKLKEAWKKAKDWWNKNKPSLSQITAKIKIPRLVITWNTTGAAAKALQKLGLKGFPNFSVRYYAMGGFPEDGWFRANHGELMGKFDNGKSVVANNRQITQGIADAVYQGNRENNALMRQELELMRRQNELLMDLVEKETGFSAREVFNTVRKEAENYKRVTGRTAFAL